MAEIGLVGGAVVVVGLAEDDDVVATTEGILEDGSRTEVDVGVMARGLVGGRPVEVPDAELADVGDLGLDGLERVSGQKRGARGQRTVVFDLKPLSPSIQTSAKKRMRSLG